MPILFTRINESTKCQKKDENSSIIYQGQSLKTNKEACNVNKKTKNSALKALNRVTTYNSRISNSALTLEAKKQSEIFIWSGNYEFHLALKKGFVNSSLVVIIVRNRPMKKSFTLEFARWTKVAKKGLLFPCCIVYWWAMSNKNERVRCRHADKN